MMKGSAPLSTVAIQAVLLAPLALLTLNGWSGGAFGEWSRAAGLAYGVVLGLVWSVPLLGQSLNGWGVVPIAFVALATLMLGGSAGFMVLMVGLIGAVVAIKFVGDAGVAGTRTVNAMVAGIILLGALWASMVRPAS